LGEQKLNDFSVREAKIGEKQSRKSTSKYSFMQQAVYVQCKWGNGVWGKPQTRAKPLKLGNFPEFLC